MRVFIKFKQKKTHLLNKSQVSMRILFFLITGVDKNYKIILCSEIIKKCIKVCVNETTSYLTDFISESEHD